MAVTASSNGAGNPRIAAGDHKTIQVCYFAVLREERGLTDEAVSTRASTAGELYDELQERHGFRLHRDNLKAVVNESFVDWDTPLRHNDEIVFIPPVAGG